jgi:WD40 repeat protein
MLAGVSVEPDGSRWRMSGVNERLRCCRYRPAQAFHIHQDGVHHRGPTQRSRLTFMIYLTDGDAFEGGDTVFFADGPRATREGEAHPPVVARVRPRAGSLILFDHRIWHAGEAVTRGVKHIVRSDVMFEAVDEAAGASGRADEHQGYVWALCALPGGRIASGGRDTAIRLWNAHGNAAGVLRGHSQSVLGLGVLDAQRLVSVSRDRTLRVWTLDAMACEQVFRPHAAAILSVATWQGLVVTGGADGAVRVTRPSDAETTTLADCGSWVWSLDVSADGRLAAACEDGGVRLFDVRSMAACDVMPGGGPLRAVAVSRDGSRFACGNAAGSITTWARLDQGWRQEAIWQGHTAAVRKLRFGADGDLYSGGEDGLAHRWSVSGRSAWDAHHENFVTDVLPVAGQVVTCAYDGRIVRHKA